MSTTTQRRAPLPRRKLDAAARQCFKARAILEEIHASQPPRTRNARELRALVLRLTGTAACVGRLSLLASHP